MLTLCLLVATPAFAEVVSGSVRHELEASVGYLFDDCPRLGRAGLAINRCDDQVADHAMLWGLRSFVAGTLGERFELSIEERLRIAVPRAPASDLSSLDAVTELGFQVDAGSAWTLHLGGLLTLHAEKDPAWQFVLVGPWLEMSLATGFGLALEARADLVLTRFPTRFLKNSYAQIDADMARTALRAKWWVSRAVRITLSWDGSAYRYTSNLDEQLDELVELEPGERRKDFTNGGELEVAFRPHPSTVIAAAFRAEHNASNVALLRYRGLGGGASLTFATGPHTFATAGRFVRYDFFDAFPARERFNNTRKDNHFELHLRYRVTLTENLSCDLSYTYILNESNDGIIFEALVEDFIADGAKPLEARGRALDEITSFTIYSRSLLEARVTVSF